MLQNLSHNVIIDTEVHEYRCTKCNKLLFKANINKGKVEIQCSRCKNINEFLREPNT